VQLDMVDAPRGLPQLQGTFRVWRTAARRKRIKKLMIGIRGIHGDIPSFVYINTETGGNEFRDTPYSHIRGTVLYFIKFITCA